MPVVLAAACDSIDGAASVIRAARLVSALERGQEMVDADVAHLALDGLRPVTEPG